MSGLPVRSENDTNKLKRAKLRAICLTPCKSTSRTEMIGWVQPKTNRHPNFTMCHYYYYYYYYYYY